MSAESLSRARRMLRYVGVLLFYVCLWALLAQLVGQELLLPGPLQVARRLMQLLPNAAFWRTLGMTLLRTAASYLLGVVFACLLAALCCRFSFAELLLSPLLSAVRAAPVTSFIVLALVWLSSARVPVLTGFLMTLPIVYASLVQAVRGIDPKLWEMARMYRFSLSAKLLHIVVPAALPAFAESCIASIGLCWKAVVAAEVIGVPKMAVGSKLYEAKIYLETDSLLAWTLVLVLLSIALEALLRRALRPLAEVRHD